MAGNGHRTQHPLPWWMEDVGGKEQMAEAQVDVVGAERLWGAGRKLCWGGHGSAIWHGEGSKQEPILLSPLHRACFLFLFSSLIGN